MRKQASQRARPSTEPAIKRGSLEQSSTNYLWALHWPFLRDFKRTCNSWPLTVLQLTKCCCWPILLFVIYWCRQKIEFLQLADCQSINQTSFDQSLEYFCTLIERLHHFMYIHFVPIFSTLNVIQWNIPMLCIQGCNKNRAGKSGVLGQYESPWCNHISLPEVDLLNVLLTSTNTEA